MIDVDASKSHFTYTKAVIRRWLESRDSTAGDITSQDVATSRDMWRITCQGTEYIEKQQEQIRKQIACAVLVLYYEKMWYSLSNIPLICKSMRMYMSNIFSCVEQTAHVRREIHTCKFEESQVHGMCKHMGASENSGTPKSSISIGFSIINHPFWGTPIFGNTHMNILNYSISMI